MTNLFAVATIVASGLLLAGLGQVFEALKEIAMNTRAAARAAGFVGSESRYAGLSFIAMAMTIVGGAMAFFGLFSGLRAVLAALQA